MNRHSKDKYKDRDIVKINRKIERQSKDRERQSVDGKRDRETKLR